MSKNYTMVQYVFPPRSVPDNAALRNAILDLAGTYIKAGKLAMGESCLDYKSDARRDAENIPKSDYRVPHSSNRFVHDQSGVINLSGQWPSDLEQIFYRVFFDQTAAQEFVQAMLDLGALSARIIVEGQSNPSLDFEYPDYLFPPEAHVAQFVWPGYPNFDYQGTYPAAGPADATPWPEN